METDVKDCDTIHVISNMNVKLTFQHWKKVISLLRKFTNNIYQKASTIKGYMNVDTKLNLMYCSTHSAEGTLDGFFCSPSSPYVYSLFFILHHLTIIVFHI